MFSEMMMKTLAKESVPVLTTIEALMTGDKKNLLEEDGEPSEMLVLTNAESHFGSIVILQEKVVDRIHEVVGDFFALPSSVHEWVIVPDNGDREPTELLEIVTSANRSVVAPEDVLGNHVFHYGEEGFTVVA